MDYNHNNSIVLTDFHAVLPSVPLPQDDSVELLALGVTKAVAVKSGKISEKQVDRIYNKVRSALKQFGATSNSIKQRCLVFGPSEYKHILGKSLVENDRFIEHDFNFPLFEDLVYKHTNPYGASLSQRIQMIDSKTVDLVQKLYANEIDPPDEIIHVTSTGYTDPNPVDKLVDK